MKTLIPAILALSACAFGSIEKLDPRLDALISTGSKIEILGEGYDWSEGPVWVPSAKHLLFCDIPKNSVMKWDGKVSLYQRPSGYTGEKPRGGEMGSNGLTLDPKGNLVLCQHGDRRVARMVNWKFETLADKYEGKRLNSPNDLCYHSSGALYFTDPPYGLEKNMDDPAKELDFQGVYRLGTDGKLTLLTKGMSRPNGIAFSPDEKKLYVANSDPKHAVWMVYDVKADGSIADGKVFFDSTSMVGPTNKGLPDGLKVEKDGNLFATGPGGVLIFAPDGKHLGTIHTEAATANCAFGEDGWLYITAHMRLLRVKTNTRPK